MFKLRNATASVLASVLLLSCVAQLAPAQTAESQLKPGVLTPVEQQKAEATLVIGLQDIQSGAMQMYVCAPLPERPQRNTFK